MEEGWLVPPDNIFKIPDSVSKDSGVVWTAGSLPEADLSLS